MGNSKACTILLFATFLNFVAGFSQNSIIDIERLSGLSDRYIKDIIRDPNGYMWIGTRNGLNRWNGLDFIVYDNRPNSEFRISSKDIKKVGYRSDNSSITIQYETNRRFIDIIESGDHKAKKLFLNTENQVAGEVEDIFIDERGLTYLLSDDHDKLYIQRLNQFHLFDTIAVIKDLPSSQASRYQLRVIDSLHYWLYDSQKGLFQLDSLGNILAELSPQDFGTNQLDDLKILYDYDGTTLMSYDDLPGIWQLGDSLSYFTKLDTFRNYERIWSDDQGNIILLADLVNEQYRYLAQLTAEGDLTPERELLLNTNPVTAIFAQDFNKMLLVGSTTGLRKVNRAKKVVKNYLNGSTRSNWTSFRGIVSLNDSIVFASGEIDTWYQINIRSDSIMPIQLNTAEDENTYCRCARELLFDEDLYGIWGIQYSDEDKAALVFLDLNSYRFTKYPFPKKIKHMTWSSDGSIWIVAGEKGEGVLTKFDKYTTNFTHYYDSDGENPIENVRPTYVLEAKNGTIWVGTFSDGLYQIDLNQNESIHHTYDETDYYGLSENSILAITESMDGKIWVGTYAGGVSVYQPETEEFVNYDTQDGLSENNVCGILEDNDHGIWLSTYDGLNFYDPELGYFRSFDRKDGFSNNEFNRFSFAKDTSDQFFIGTVNGLNVFRATDLLERNLDQPIILTELSFFDKSSGQIVTKYSGLHQIQTVNLPATNRYFHCAFSLADYRYPEDNQFMYKLEGRDLDFNYLGSQNEIRLNNLPSGKYKLIIRGADRNGNQSSQELNLALTIGDFFYRQTWFIVFCLLLIISAVYLYLRVKLRQAIKMERLRTKISSDLHDDVGGLLSGLAMQTELLEITANPTDKPKLHRISDMSRNAMAKMRDVIWATDARNDTFGDLIIRMKEHAAEMLFPKGISCNFYIHHINEDKKIPVNIRQNLYLIFKEAITNIAKHSNASIVKINLSKSGSRFEMHIKDDSGNATEINGSHHNNRQGSGLSNMKLRAEKINADLEIHKEKGYQIDLEMKSFV